MGKTNAGVVFKGRWNDICAFARDFERVIEKNAPDSNEGSIREYDHWRPKVDEDEKDISEKTAENACMDRKKIEKKYNGAKEELKSAGEKIKNGVNGEEPPTKNIKEASKKVERLVEAESIKSIRKLERMIYKEIMLRFNPYYFDTEEFSVNLEKVNNEKGDDQRYKITINIPDEELREKVKDELIKRVEDER